VNVVLDANVRSSPLSSSARKVSAANRRFYSRFGRNRQIANAYRDDVLCFGNKRAPIAVFRFIVNLKNAL
jgi:hypothetical protein